MYVRYESHVLDFDHFPFFNLLPVPLGHVTLVAVLHRIRKRKAKMWRRLGAPCRVLGSIIRGIVATRF